MVHLHLAYKGEQLFYFFVHFSSAFDTIVRKSLFFKLSSLGVSTHIVRAIQNLYTQTEAGIWCKDPGSVLSVNDFVVFKKKLKLYLIGKALYSFAEFCWRVVFVIVFCLK